MTVCISQLDSLFVAVDTVRRTGRSMSRRPAAKPNKLCGTRRILTSSLRFKTTSSQPMWSCWSGPPPLYTHTHTLLYTNWYWRLRPSCSALQAPACPAPDPLILSADTKASSGRRPVCREASGWHRRWLACPSVINVREYSQINACKHQRRGLTLARGKNTHTHTQKKVQMKVQRRGRSGCSVITNM